MAMEPNYIWQKCGMCEFCTVAQHDGFMNTNRRLAVAALAGAGLLWGTTVPLSKLALQWLPTGWLTATRFGLAAAVLLAVVRRTRPGRGEAGRPRLRLAGR